MTVSVEARPAPAKAMAVSIPLEHERAKATTVSDNRTTCPAVPIVGARGRGGARPGDRWADDVTNVVKPKRFEAPCEACCYKRRQSAPKNHYFQRKSRRIDDVCNNGSKIHTKNTSD